MQRRIAHLSLILLLLSFNSNAEPDMDAMIGLEQEYLQDLPIVLSATRLAQPLSEAPVAMTVIDREMIEASGARTIPDILRLVPGFQVGYFDGNTPVATYHGHADEFARNLQVLIDGRSIYLPSRNAVSWSDLIISIEDIERIEVIRGPNAATYGSNSFMAVVSITTRHSIENQGHYVRVRKGSQNTNDVLYTFGSQEGKLDYHFTLNTTNDNGTDALPDDTEADSFGYRLDFQIDTLSRLMYKGGYKKGEYGDHIPAPPEDPLAEHTVENNSAYQHIKWEQQLKNNDSISLQYYYNYHRHHKVPPVRTFTTADFDIPNNLAPPYDVLSGLTFEDAANLADLVFYPGAGDLIRFDSFDYSEMVDITSERHDIEFNHYLYPSNELRLVWGLSARQDIVKAPNFFDDPSTQRLNMYRAFAHGEWNFRKDWLLNAGYLIEDNDISGNDRSPRLALIHHINPNHTIRIGMSKATRTPTLFEEAGQVVYAQELTLNDGPLPPGHLLENYNPVTYTSLLTPGNLDAEKITSYEFGYIANLVKNKLILDVKIFKDQSKRLITFDDTRMTSDYTGITTDLNANGNVDLLINGIDSETKGAEIALDYHISNTLRLYTFYAKLEIESTHYINSTEDKWTVRLNNTVPEHSGGFMLIKNWQGNIDTSIAYYNVGDMDWLDRTSTKSALPYQKVDMRIAKSWRTGNETLKVALIGQNLKEDVIDYNNETTTDPNTGEVRAGSIQDKRFYIELSYLFN